MNSNDAFKKFMEKLKHDFEHPEGARADRKAVQESVEAETPPGQDLFARFRKDKKE